MLNKLRGQGALATLALTLLIPAQGQQTSSIVVAPVPDALTFQKGKPVRNKADWQKRRREIMSLFAAQIYGQNPAASAKFHAHSAALVEHGPALNGMAIRKQVDLAFTRGPETRTIHVLIYLPARTHAPSPIILGLNFAGNQTVSTDPHILLSRTWARDPQAKNATNGERSQPIGRTALENSRGKASSRWQMEAILSHGYGLATAYYGDIEPDFAGGFPYGIRALFLKPGQTSFAPDEWGALGAWAWGMSRVADYLQSDSDVDGSQIALFGFSRLGKAALWAAAQDERFRLVLSNESGVGGASLYRAKTGESIEHLNTAFPHWFCGNFQKYTGQPERVPVDGNLLLSLVAPRPLYVGSAEEDHGSCPPAEFLSTALASNVYRLLGEQGLPAGPMPPVNHPDIGGAVAYHVRSGKHDVTAFDWEHYLAFMDQHFRRR